METWERGWCLGIWISLLLSVDEFVLVWGREESSRICDNWREESTSEFCNANPCTGVELSDTKRKEAASLNSAVSCDLNISVLNIPRIIWKYLLDCKDQYRNWSYQHLLSFRKRIDFKELMQNIQIYNFESLNTIVWLWRKFISIKYL